MSFRLRFPIHHQRQNLHLPGTLHRNRSSAYAGHLPIRNHFTQAGTNTICLTIPMTKEELGGCLGRASCAMLAVTDVGFAAAMAERLAKADEKTYGPARDALKPKAAKANKRRKLSKKGKRKTDRGASGPNEKESRNDGRKDRP